MSKKRKLIWRKESSFEGGVCSECGWLRSNPRLLTASKTPAQDVQDAFDAHICAKHPGPKKPHEDVNQAAARIVKEATEE